MKQRNLHSSSSGFRSWMTRLSFLIVMILIGTSSFAQKENLVKATDNRSFIEAIESDVDVIRLTEGTYEFKDLKIHVGQGETFHFNNGSKTGENESRANCSYTIPTPSGAPACGKSTPLDFELIETTGLTCDPITGSGWTWETATAPSGGSVNFTNPLSDFSQPGVTVTVAGSYNLQYFLTPNTYISRRVTWNPVPAEPTYTDHDPTCDDDGYLQIDNYDSNYDYTFDPAVPGATINSTTGIVSGLAFGQSYTLVAESGDGCTSDPAGPFELQEEKVTPLTPEVSVTPQTCDDDAYATIDNYDATYTYTFDPSPTVTPTISAGGVVDGLSTGVSYTVTAELDGCFSPASEDFGLQEANPTPNVPTYTAHDPTCDDDGYLEITNYDATYDYTFDPSPTVTPTISASGIVSGLEMGQSYTFTAENGDGCISDPAGPFELQEEKVTPEKPEVSVTPQTCDDDAYATIDNYDETYTYTFDPSPTVTPTISAGGVVDGLSTGVNYTVTAELDGCFSPASEDFGLQEANPDPVLEINPDPADHDDPLNPEYYSGGTYTWELENVTAETVSTTTVTFTHPFDGEHTIIYTDEADGCEGTISTTVTVKPNQLAGQVKYYNEQEGPMPSPFMTNTNNQNIPDYFNVLLLSDADYTTLMSSTDLGDYLTTVGYSTLTSPGTPELKKVEEYYGEENGENYHPALADDEYYEAAFGFETNVDPGENYRILVWDGGFVHEDGNENANEGDLTEAWTWNNWGGVNATDALLIQHMSVGNVNDPDMSNPDRVELGYIGAYLPGTGYNTFAEYVADVSGNDAISALDALLTQRKGTGMPVIFPNDKPNFGVAGIFVDESAFNTDVTADMIFNNDIPESFNYAGADAYQGTTDALAHNYYIDFNSLPTNSTTAAYGTGTNYLNIYYDATGDINASYQPTYGGWKSAPELQYEGEMLAEVGEEITLPISIDQFETLGAISLDLDYRKDLIEVVGVNYGEDNVYVDDENGRIGINWFDINTKDFNAGASIAEITVKVKQAFDKQTRLFELNEAELADGRAEVIDGVNFKSYSVSTAADDLGSATLTSTNSPNPFKESTNIQFTLPESGKVQVVLYDMMGNVVDNILEQDMKAGQQNVEYRANNLNSGVYQYRIILQGEKRDYSVIRSIVVM